MRTALAAIVALALSGCMMVGPNYKRPEVNLPQAYSETGAGAALGVPSDWWRLYRDPALDDLVASGLQKNADVKLAIARIEEAEGLIREANATLLPQVDANVTSGRSHS